MANKKAPTPSPLVAQLYDLDAQISALQELREPIAAALIVLGAGVYIESAPRIVENAPSPALRTVTVVVPTEDKVSWDLYPAGDFKSAMEEQGIKKPKPEDFSLFQRAREIMARELAGESFAALFDRHVLFRPKKAYAELAAALLTPAKARDTIALCKITAPPAAASLRMPDKPKKPKADGKPDPDADEEPLPPR
jgi:hypothetical protein